MQDTGQSSRPPQPGTMAFRISNIPSCITGDQFLQILEGLSDASSGGGQRNVLGWSFAPSAASVDAQRYRTATVTFKSVPIEFQIPRTSDHLLVNLVPNTPPVIVDKHFYGLTPLNCAEHLTVEYAFSGPSLGKPFSSLRNPLIDLALSL